VFRWENMRAGAIKTEKGWTVQDFAPSFFNPNSVPIIITLTMVSDDPKFVFSNGRIGTYTKTYVFKPLFGATDNIYIGAPAFGKPDWPVTYGINFTGSVEYASSEPFYLVMLGDPETGIGEDGDLTKAYFKAWGEEKTSGGSVATAEMPMAKDSSPKPSAVRATKGVAMVLGGVAWDNDLKQFVVPYTNYWHNETSWTIGARSRLNITNGNNQPVTYALRHIPFYGAQFNPKNKQITRYQEQTVQMTLQPHESRSITLPQLYGWAADQMSDMEGCLLIGLDRDAAPAATNIQCPVEVNESGVPMHDAIY
jgi:hypothetical protein